MLMTTVRPRHLVVAAALLALTGCSSTSAPESTDAKADAAKASTVLTVYAAASLQEAFDQLAGEFQQAHPDISVELSYDGSSTLAKQIIGGAPVDVFASADEANMTKVQAPSLVAGEPTIFARNTMTIAIPPNNPAQVASVADLGKSDLDVVVCAAEVPCGALSRQILSKAGITLSPVSEEQNVKAVLTKVAAGEADAGLVYTTDVKAAAGKVSSVDLPEELTALTTAYPIAVLSDAPQPVAARQFVDFVTSDRGMSVLAHYGFTAP